MIDERWIEENPDKISKINMIIQVFILILDE